MVDLKNSKKTTLSDWRSKATSTYITTAERKEGIRVTFLCDAPYEEPSQFGTMNYVWKVMDGSGERLLSGSMNFVRHLGRFVKEYNIDDLTNVTLDIQQIGEGMKTSYIIKEVS